MERKVKYTYEFKLRCVEEVLKKHQTLVATAKEGLAGLKLKRIGRPVSMNIKRKKRKSNQPLSREEELLRELEYLRAENEILKKFNALVQAEQAKQNKRLKP